VSCRKGRIVILKDNFQPLAGIAANGPQEGT
jgi:hypothetical protein